VVDKIEGGVILPAGWLTQTVSNFAQRVLKGLECVGHGGPFSLAVTLLRVKDVWLAADKHFDMDDGRPFDREVVMLPDVVVSSDDTRTSLAPLFDYLWQAAGYPCSPQSLG
jgi:hypothetical protein